MPLRKVAPQSQVAPGTGFHFAVAATLTILFGPLLLLFVTIASYGIGTIIWLVSLYMRAKKAHAQLHGSALKVGPRQFAEVHSAATDLCAALNVKELPAIYILEDNKQNALAIKHGKNHYVILIDDIVYGAEATGNPDALRWILAHEIAHHALGHTGLFRRILTTWYKKLARLDEESCDRVAHAVLADPAATRDALALLLVGPHLYAKVDRAALEQQAREVAADKYTKKAEARESHPFLLHRYAKLIPMMPRLPVTGVPARTISPSQVPAAENVL